MKKIQIGNCCVGQKEKLLVMSGPCVIESEEHALYCAEKLVEICHDLPVELVFKASYDKANRSSLHSFRGPGIEKGLEILQKVKEEFNILVVSDIHTPQEASSAQHVLDIMQIPAFLSRQTDLIVAAGKTGRVVQVKKGQFMAPWDMKNVVDKLEESGCENILLCDRGTSFGYNNLVSDMRAITVMQDLGYPVVFDASHSVQLPGGQGSCSGGQRQFIPTLAKAAIAAGADGLFLETHPDPAQAKSDAASVYPLEKTKDLLLRLCQIYQIVKSVDADCYA